MTITTEGRIYPGNPIGEYFNAFAPEYGKMLHYTFQRIKLIRQGKLILQDHKLNRELQDKYNIPKRTANSLIFEAKGIFKSQEELLQVQTEDLQNRIDELVERINKLGAELDQLSIQARDNKLSEDELRDYRKKKEKIHWMKNKLNTYRVRLSNMQNKLKNKEFSVCFGTKRLFHAQTNPEANGIQNHEAWRRKFQNARSTHIFYVGSKDEKCGNQQFQMSYNKDNGLFDIRVRKAVKDAARGDVSENSAAGTDGDSESMWIHDEVEITYQKEALIKALESKNQPVTVRLLRRDPRKFYVQVTFDIPEPPVLTGVTGGTTGLDFNEGFIAVAETDACGNLIEIGRIDLLNHGGGGRAEAELEEKLCRLVHETAAKGKSIVCEDLDFRKKKAKRMSGSAKNYNAMIHTLDYKRYLETLERNCLRTGVELKKINPAYTSRAAKILYIDKMKLNIHTGAAYVIARIGQGKRIDWDKVKPKKQIGNR